jgi:hypothetical protein
MIYPYAQRLEPSNAGKFFQGHVRPRLPEAKGMGTDNAPTNITDEQISDSAIDQISANARVLMIASFSLT